MTAPELLLAVVDGGLRPPSLASCCACGGGLSAVLASPGRAWRCVGVLPNLRCLLALALVRAAAVFTFGAAFEAVAIRAEVPRPLPRLPACLPRLPFPTALASQRTTCSTSPRLRPRRIAALSVRRR